MFQIVFADADITRAVNGVAFGAFVASGQTCVSAARLLVERSVIDQVVPALVAKANGIVVGDPLRSETQMGRYDQSMVNHLPSSPFL